MCPLATWCDFPTNTSDAPTESIVCHAGVVQRMVDNPRATVVKPPACLMTGAIGNVQHVGDAYRVESSSSIRWRSPAAHAHAAKANSISDRLRQTAAFRRPRPTLKPPQRPPRQRHAVEDLRLYRQHLVTTFEPKPFQ
jgi:hypothetical protein